MRFSATRFHTLFSVPKIGNFSLLKFGPFLSLTVVKELPFYYARVDSKAIINIYDWVWSGQKWYDIESSNAICLSTQSSMDRLYWVTELVQNWNGPISLAVFITSQEEWIGLNLVVHHFLKCYQPFRDFVSIHVAISTKIENWKLNWESGNTEHFVKDFIETSCEIHPKVVVGQACGVRWLFSTDIDIIPVANSAKLLQEFIYTQEAQSCEKCAFVIPTFELDENFSFPETKYELIQHWKNKSAVPFHFKIFDSGHKSTDYSKWSETNLEDGPVKISHDAVNTSMQYYEPFYMSRNRLHEFPERFIGYGFTRSSQVQQALSEGWEFKVLTPIFTIHWGLQSKETLLSPGDDRSIRKLQTHMNGRIYTLFKKELDFRKKLKIEEDTAMKRATPDFSE